MNVKTPSQPPDNLQPQRERDTNLQNTNKQQTLLEAEMFITHHNMNYSAAQNKHTDELATLRGLS